MPFTNREVMLVFCVTNRRYPIPNVIKVGLLWLQRFCSVPWLTHNLLYHNSPVVLHLERPEGGEFVSTGWHSTVGFGSSSSRDPHENTASQAGKIQASHIHTLWAAANRVTVLAGSNCVILLFLACYYASGIYFIYQGIGPKQML